MPANFFHKEVIKAQKRFNQTFGMLPSCDIKLRHAVILNICGLRCLGNKIMQATDKSEVKDDIRRFIKMRDTLNNIFATVEKIQNERRENEKDCSKKTKQNYG